MQARMRITILCENLVGRLDGWGEPGFSVFIESSQGNYLFDTGNGHGIVANSLTLGKDLKTVKKLNAKYGFGHVLDMKELFQFIRYLPPDKIRRNKELEGKIAKGQCLHNALAEVRFLGEHRA